MADKCPYLGQNMPYFALYYQNNISYSLCNKNALKRLKMRNEKSYKIYVEKFGKLGIMSYLCCGKGMQVISVNKKRTIV